VIDRNRPARRGAAWPVVAAIAVALLAFLPWSPVTSPVRAAASVNLDQWATLDHAWQNGNLNGNNTRYPEGGIVPFRLAVEGLSKGSHSIRIQYDFTAGGHKAYDFLARYNGWVSPPMCAPSGGAISSMCPSLPTPSSAAFPSDGFKTDGLTVKGAEAYSGVVRRLTIWGGSITSISGPAHAGSTGGNSTAEFTVKFTSTGSAVLLAWGGHLAQSRYWQMSIGGPRDGAGEVSGAPWHMRTLQLDGSGNRNQDRSIQPSAIVGELPPRALAPPTPTPRPTPRPPIVPTVVVTPKPPGGGGPGGPVDPPMPTAPATSTGPAPVTPEPGGRWDFAIVLGLVALGGFALALARTRRPVGPDGQDRRRS
jgi:hypothetical protein